MTKLPTVACLLLSLLVGCRDRGTELVTLSHELGDLIVSTDTSVVCQACAMQADLLAAYGHHDDAVLLRRLPRLIKLGKGTLLAYVPRAEGHELIAYRSEGVERVGRLGSGPGEYETVGGAAAIGDTLIVTHDGIRLTRYLAGTAISHSRLPGPPADVIAAKDSVLVVVRRIERGRRDASAAVDLLAPSGRRSEAKVRPVMTSGVAAWTAAPSRTGFWVAEQSGNYRIQHVDDAGRVTRTIVRRSPGEWYLGTYVTRAALDSMIAVEGSKDITSVLMGRPKHRPFPPASRITGLFEAGSVLWVSLIVPSDDWRSVVLDYRDEELEPTEESSSRLYRTIIEAVDIASADALSRISVPGIGSILGDGSLGIATYDSSGVINVKLYRLALTSLQ